MSYASRTLEAPVVTVLDPHERQQVDAAGAGFYRAIHRDSVADALEDLKHRPVSALLVSVVRCGRERDRRVHTAVREFPTVPTVALLGAEPTTAEALLHLGNAGITRLVDVRSPAGWHRLRNLLDAEVVPEVDRLALAAIRRELGDATPEALAFFESLLTTSGKVATVRSLALRLQVLPSTLMSRFFRAHLPSPKRYLAFARLLRAARSFEDPGHSISDVSNALEYSSPQGFSRHVRTLLGLTAGEFRRTHDGARMLERMLDELVRPHREGLRTLRPVPLRAGGRLPPSLAETRPARQRRAPD